MIKFLIHTFHLSNSYETKLRIKISIVLSLFLVGWGVKAQVAAPFITTWRTDNPGGFSPISISIPTTGTGYNYDVDWNNDGIFDDFCVTGNITHDYETEGTYEVAIRGEFPRIFFASSSDKEKIISIEQWGDIAWQSMEDSFRGCTNLTGSASDIPDFSVVTDMSLMFASTSKFNDAIGNWDVSSVTNMRSTFFRATAFNQDIGNWKVGNVTDMGYIFYGATAFNHAIGNWDVGAVIDMNSMFSEATAFNQAIGNWDVSDVTIMAGMF